MRYRRMQQKMLPSICLNGAKLLLGLWGVCAFVSTLALLVTLVPIFSIPFVGIFLPPFLLSVVMEQLLRKLKVKEAFANALSWVDDTPRVSDLSSPFSEDGRESMKNDSKHWLLFFDFRQLRSDTEHGMAKKTVYVALLSTVASPMLILGGWLAFYVFSGISDPSGIAHAYLYYYHVDGFTMKLPDLLAFLDVDGWQTALEVLADLEDWTSIDPGSLLIASNVVLGVQAALGIFKAIIVAGNSILQILAGDMLGYSKGSVGLLILSRQQLDESIEYYEQKWAEMARRATTMGMGEENWVSQDESDWIIDQKKMQIESEREESARRGGEIALVTPMMHPDRIAEFQNTRNDEFDL